MPAGDERVHGKRHVANAAAEGAHLVERGAEGHHAVTRDGAVRGLHAHDSAERGRLADGAACVGAQGQRDLAGRHGRGTAARGATGNALEVPRVIGAMERAGLRGGGAGGARTHEVHVVLDGQGHAGKRRELLAGGAGPVDARGRLEGELGRDLEERLHGAVALLDGVERGMRHLGCREVAGDDAVADLRGGEGVEGAGHLTPHPHPGWTGRGSSGRARMPRPRAPRRWGGRDARRRCP